MLEAKIVEVSLARTFQSGINWGASAIPRGGHRFGVAAPAPTRSDPGTADSAVATAGQRIVHRHRRRAASGFYGLAFQASNFAAMLNFLESQGDVHVLSSPRIATLNNQKACSRSAPTSFTSPASPPTEHQCRGQTAARPRSPCSPSSAASCSTSRRRSTSRARSSCTCTRRSAGDRAREEHQPRHAGQLPLPLASSSINETDSIVRVPDGQIVAIGGLMVQETARRAHRLPVLSEVPVVGICSARPAREPQARAGDPDQAHGHPRRRPWPDWRPRWPRAGAGREPAMRADPRPRPTMARPERIRLGDLLTQEQLLSRTSCRGAGDPEALGPQARPHLHRQRLGHRGADRQGGGAPAARALSPSSRRASLRPEVARLLPEVQARRLRALPLEDLGATLRVAMADPTDLAASTNWRLLKREVELVVAESQLLAALDRSYTRASRSPAWPRSSRPTSPASRTSSATCSACPPPRRGRPGGAAAARCSRRRCGARLRHPHRAAGAHAAHPLPHRRRAACADRGRPKIAGAVALRLKLMSGLDISEKRLPQDGRFNVKLKPARWTCASPPCPRSTASRW
jgi:hypothetical protein